MGRREDEEGISSGRYVHVAPVHQLRANPIGIDYDNAYHFGGIAGLADAYGSVTNIRWIDSAGQVITQATKGQPITLMVDFFAELPSGSLSWRATVTAMEVGVPVTSAWKNYVEAHTWANSMEKPNFKLTQMRASKGGSFVMPDRDLNVVVKLWVRGDLVEDYPPVGENWRS